MKHFFSKHGRVIIPIAALGVVALILATILYTVYFSSLDYRAAQIADDVAYLARVFDDIERTAGIAGFDYQKNRIDFLNIKKDGFVGSEVGSLNLKEPKKWQGPYSKEIATFNEEDYMVVKTNQGYFIVPADGTVLANGKTIGIDIILDEHADINAMMINDHQLAHKGKSLAAKINVGEGYRMTDEKKLVIPENGD